MRSAKFVFIFFLIGAFLSACGGAPRKSQSSHNSYNSLDWHGTYEGVLPCASCPGIKTSLTLQKDGRYELRTRNLNESSEIQLHHGQFRWNAEGNRIQLLGLNVESRPTQYGVQENRLVQLDLKGERITGALAENYILQKITTTLTGREWRLAELSGETLRPAQGAAPNLSLSTTENRVAGNNGCNRFFGEFKAGATGIDGVAPMSFSALGSTRMACLDPARSALEPKFMEALQNTNAYKLRGHILELYMDTQMLLRFETQTSVDAK